ncbi:MAG: hypothetical protein ACR2P4_10255 [Gammaproteobacteria bacterium]
MTADNFGDNADKTANPQNAGGAARAGDAPVFSSSADAPMFVSGCMEYFRNAMRPVNFGFASRIKHRRWLLCFTFALFYMLAFSIAEGLFPHFYRTWLDLCMPLAEYVGGLTPRAGLVTERLVAGGYPERADDALHGIAIARVLMIPVFVCMLAGSFFATHPSSVFVSCTRWTHIKIWLRLFLGIAGALALTWFFCTKVELVAGTKIGDNSVEFLDKHVKYHRGNFYMWLDLLFMFVVSAMLVFATSPFAMMRRIHFAIVKQPPGDKS